MAFLASIPVLGSLITTAGTAATATTGLTAGQLLTGASTVLSAAGSLYTGAANAAAAKYQSGVAAVNAMIARDNAAAARQRSQEAQMEQDMLTLGQLGEQEALQSATGLGGRSQMLTRKASIELGRQDAMRIRNTGEMDAYNFENQARSFDAEAGMRKASASNSLLSGFLNATQSIVGGAASINNPNRFNALQRKSR